MTKFKGRWPTQITGGRLPGVSTNKQVAFRRLWNDLHLRPIESLTLGEGTIFNDLYYTVEIVGGNWGDIEQWCENTFGHIGDVYMINSARWYINDYKVWFRDEHDRTLFILRWS